MTQQKETLYSLTDKVLLLLEYVEGSENPEELAQLLEDNQEALQLSIDEKLEGLMTIRQNRIARMNALKEEADRLSKLAKQEEKEIEKLTKYAEFELTRLGHTYKDKKLAKRTVGKFNLKFKKLPPKLEIVDASKIPTQYMNVPPTPAAKPDAKELLDLLKEKAEFLHGKKWTEQIEGLALDEFGIKLINNNSKFEIE